MNEYQNPFKLHHEENNAYFERWLKPQLTDASSRELHVAQPDREYSGEVIGFQDDSAIQEISPGVAVEHRGISSAMCRDDIGKSFSISYDGQGNVQIKELGAERGREKDIER